MNVLESLSGRRLSQGYVTLVWLGADIESEDRGRTSAALIGVGAIGGASGAVITWCKFNNTRSPGRTNPTAPSLAAAVSAPPGCPTASYQPPG